MESHRRGSGGRDENGRNAQDQPGALELGKIARKMARSVFVRPARRDRERTARTSFFRASSGVTPNSLEELWIMRILKDFAALLACLLAALPASAQEYPNRAVKIIVPFATGG